MAIEFLCILWFINDSYVFRLCCRRSVFHPAFFAFRYQASSIHEIFQAVLQSAARKIRFQFTSDTLCADPVGVFVHDSLDGLQFLYRYALCQFSALLAYTFYAQLKQLYTQLSTLCAIKLVHRGVPGELIFRRRQGCLWRIAVHACFSLVLFRYGRR